MEEAYDYICALVEEEFEKEYLRLEKTGVLQFEITNILSYSLPLFEEGKQFSIEDPQLRYLIIGGISEYFENEVKESVSWDIIHNKN
jgi:hypothetical protein